MKKVFIWEKWVNPVGNKKEEDTFLPERQYEENFEEEEVKQRKRILSANYFAATPFGLLPIAEHNDPEKEFDFWVCHTDFVITEEYAEIIAETLGVEISNFFSPYRFRIAVGKAFTFKEVKNRIEAALRDNEVESEQYIIPPKVNETLKGEILEKAKELGNDSKFWLLLALPNGTIETSKPKDFKSHQRKKQIMAEARDLAGGILIASDD